MGYHWVLNLRIASWGAHAQIAFQKCSLLGSPSPISGLSLHLLSVLCIVFAFNLKDCYVPQRKNRVALKEHSRVYATNCTVHSQACNKTTPTHHSNPVRPDLVIDSDVAQRERVIYSFNDFVDIPYLSKSTT